MIHFDIPGLDPLPIKHLVLDFNGTLAVDGTLIPGVKSRLSELGRDLDIHVLTADTFGTVEASLKDVPCTVSVLPPGNQDQGKLDYIKTLGTLSTICIGNGRNDRLMLKEAALGIAVILGEGAASVTLFAADVVSTSITDALDLLINPLRLTASLRC
jgi:soluble P-type ATPase